MKKIKIRIDKVYAEMYDEEPHIRYLPFAQLWDIFHSEDISLSISPHFVGWGHIDVLGKAFEIENADVPSIVYSPSLYSNQYVVPLPALVNFVEGLPKELKEKIISLVEEATPTYRFKGIEWGGTLSDVAYPVGYSEVFSPVEGWEKAKQKILKALRALL